MNGPNWCRIGAISGALAVVLGAFGAHGIAPTPAELEQKSPGEVRVIERRMANYETAARYQMYHALSLLGVGVVATIGKSRPRSLNVAGWSFLIGSLIFCGTLYVLGVGGPKWLGMITPIGGLAFIAGWIALAVASRGVDAS